MILTTAQKVNQHLVEKALKLSQEWQIPFVPRKDRSVQTLYEAENTKEILMVLQNQIKWYVKGIEAPFFFHPGLSVVRIKRMLRGDNDIMVKACQLQPGDTFLDCTLGLAADAIVASFVVGDKGKVYGVESQELVASLVQYGLREVQLFPEIDQASRRIEVICEHHLHYLYSLPDKSMDIVYFDPMFRQGVEKSSSIGQLRMFANAAPLSLEVMEQAKRVARKRVLLKERRESGEFDRLGFSIIGKESMGVGYGVVEV